MREIENEVEKVLKDLLQAVKSRKISLRTLSEGRRKLGKKLDLALSLTFSRSCKKLDFGSLKLSVVIGREWIYAVYPEKLVCSCPASFFRSEEGPCQHLISYSLAESSDLVEVVRIPEGDDFDPLELVIEELGV